MKVSWVVLLQYIPKRRHKNKDNITSLEIYVETEGWGQILSELYDQKYDQGENIKIKVVKLQICCFEKGRYKD